MATKRIRIEIPRTMPREISLKVIGNATKIIDQTLLPKEKRILGEMEVPENLKIIRVFSSSLNPVDSICQEWSKRNSNSDWRLSGLKKIYAFDDITIHNITVEGEKPDISSWMEKQHINEKKAIFLRTWAFVVYVMETESMGEIYLKS